MLLLLPRSQRPVDRDQLAMVISVVVGHEERFAQEGLAVAVREMGANKSAAGSATKSHIAFRSA